MIHIFWRNALYLLPFSFSHKIFGHGQHHLKELSVCRKNKQKWQQKNPLEMFNYLSVNSFTTKETKPPSRSRGRQNDSFAQTSTQFQCTFICKVKEDDSAMEFKEFIQNKIQQWDWISRLWFEGQKFSEECTVFTFILWKIALTKIYLVNILDIVFFLVWILTWTRTNQTEHFFFFFKHKNYILIPKCKCSANFQNFSASLWGAMNYLVRYCEIPVASKMFNLFRKNCFAVCFFPSHFWKTIL